MENKSLFAAISLTIVLVSGLFFYNNQITQLENEVASITTEYNAKIGAIQSVDKAENNIKTSVLEDLNNQLITARSALQEAQQQLTLATSKSSVLNDEMSQMDDARSEVSTLKGSLKETQGSLQTTQKELTLSGEKYNTLRICSNHKTKQLLSITWLVLVN